MRGQAYAALWKPANHSQGKGTGHRETLLPGLGKADRNPTRPEPWDRTSAEILIICTAPFLNISQIF